MMAIYQARLMQDNDILIVKYVLKMIIYIAKMLYKINCLGISYKYKFTTITIIKLCRLELNCGRFMTSFSR